MTPPNKRVKALGSVLVFQKNKQESGDEAAQ
jgi:hypothetical protein